MDFGALIPWITRVLGACFWFPDSARIRRPRENGHSMWLSIELELRGGHGEGVGGNAGDTGPDHLFSTGLSLLVPDLLCCWYL